MSPKFPARLHVILARDSSTAVVFRRGPSHSVCTLSWDRRTDAFSLGQWLKGRIYERRADLSPDGKYLIYFAMNGKWGSETGGSWTAISRPPWLKAITLYGKGDCWNGGGLFTGKRSYWLNGADMHTEMHSSKEVTKLDRYRVPQQFGSECTGVYYVRLLRDGWVLKEHTGGNLDSRTVFEKPLEGGWVLRKIAHEQVRQPVGKSVYWDEHELENPKRDDIHGFPDWEWAELDGRDLVFAEKGCLYRSKLNSDSPFGDARLLYDFNDMTFEPIEAPY